MTLDMKRDDRRQAAIAGIQQNINRTAASIKPLPPITVQPMAPLPLPPPHVTCQSTAMGNTVTTNCN
jgi:hypothetical protein